MVYMIPFDFVAEVRCFLGLVFASSKANRMTLSTLFLVKYGCLNYHFLIGTLVHLPANVGIFSLVIFSHNDYIDVIRFFVLERTFHPFEELNRPSRNVIIQFIFATMFNYGHRRRVYQLVGKSLTS